MWKLPLLLTAMKIQQDCLKGKMMMDVFRMAGHHTPQVIPEEAIVSKRRNKEMLTCVQEAVCLKCPQMWMSKDWLL
jgi:hypothetical protein